MPPDGSPAGAADLLGLVGDDGLGGEEQPAIDAAFCSAERVTLAGSMMPAANRSTYSPVAALRPWPAGAPTPSRDDAALEAGVERDLLERASMATRRCSHRSPRRPRARASRTRLPAWMRATPPPATMPSSTAAFALRTASSMRCLRSLSSTSVAAPP
jgi:hypothetical protein